MAAVRSMRPYAVAGDYAVKNIWHCLGACQTGGAAIDWVMRAEGVSFRYAVELQ